MPSTPSNPNTALKVTLIALPIAFVAVAIVLSTAAVYTFKSGIFSRGPTEAEIDFAKRQGDHIIAAIAEYKADHDTAPQSLDQLVPTYLPNIPAPTATGQQWLYIPRDRDPESYYLSYDWGTWNPMIYTTGNAWSVDTK